MVILDSWSSSDRLLSTVSFSITKYCGEALELWSDLNHFIANVLLCRLKSFENRSVFYKVTNSWNLITYLFGTGSIPYSKCFCNLSEIHVAGQYSLTCRFAGHRTRGSSLCKKELECCWCCSVRITWKPEYAGSPHLFSLPHRANMLLRKTWVQMAPALIFASA